MANFDDLFTAPTATEMLSTQTKCFVCVLGGRWVKVGRNCS